MRGCKDNAVRDKAVLWSKERGREELREREGRAESKAESCRGKGIIP